MGSGPEAARSDLRVRHTMKVHTAAKSSRSSHCSYALLLATNRNRKKWRPQREQRNGKSIQRRALSNALRTPTLLKST